MPTSLWLVVTTFPDRAIATSTAHELVKAKLAACIQVLPAMTSIYTWQEQVCTESEVLMLLKTPSDRYCDLETRLRQLHPYDQPEIMALEAAAVSEGYLAWAIATTR